MSLNLSIISVSFWMVHKNLHNAAPALCSPHALSLLLSLPLCIICFFPYPFLYITPVHYFIRFLTVWNTLLLQRHSKLHILFRANIISPLKTSGFFHSVIISPLLYFHDFCDSTEAISKFSVVCLFLPPVCEDCTLVFLYLWQTNHT